MSSHTYTDDQLVEQPVIGLFAALGWQKVSAMEETFGTGGTLGRETRGEVVQTHRLCAMLTRLNPEQRHVRENLTQEELVIFDILTRPAPELYGQKCSQFLSTCTRATRSETLGCMPPDGMVGMLAILG